MGVWAAGSGERMPTLADAIPRYVETVTIWAHADAAGRNRRAQAGRAAPPARRRSLSRGGGMKEHPDANDTLRTEGAEGVVHGRHDRARKFKGNSPRPPPPQPVLSAAELMSMTFPPIKYVVPGVMVEGLTFLVGKPGLGKSWLLLHTAIAVARGGFTLGDIHSIEGDVLYCALEDNPRRLKTRLIKLLGPAQTAETFAATFETNVLGVVLSMKHEVRVMQPQGSGSIINISSTYGHRGAAYASIYVGAKHAVEGITKSVALELAKTGIV